MGFLEDFGYWLALDVLRLQKGSALAESAAFFTYDVIKVFALLAVMVFLVSIVRTFVTHNRIRKWLSGRNELAGNALAAILGIPTPFCSCSAVPIFIGLVESGVPLGVTFSFLIASPTINEVAIALLFGLFGWEVTALYIVSGLAIAIIAGFAIGKMGLEHEVEDFVYRLRKKKGQEKRMKWKQRIEFAKQQTAAIVSKVAPYIVLGIGVGALIHGYAPTDFLAGIAGKGNPLAVPLVVLVGIPLYSNAAGTIPIVQALMSKGMAMGTALAFMMSVTALSLPEMVILRKVLKPKLLAVFAAVLFIAFVLTGLLFNAIIG
jgi:uncharacterized membrane protein YraQ (UPF0718 family)